MSASSSEEERWADPPTYEKSTRKRSASCPQMDSGAPEQAGPPAQLSGREFLVPFFAAFALSCLTGVGISYWLALAVLLVALMALAFSWVAIRLAARCCMQILGASPLLTGAIGLLLGTFSGNHPILRALLLCAITLRATLLVLGWVWRCAR